MQILEFKTKAFFLQKNYVPIAFRENIELKKISIKLRLYFFLNFYNLAVLFLFKIVFICVCEILQGILRDSSVL